ncbi:glycoside hydrolase family 76 protein [Gordonia rhizosphera]|uniref:Putative glycoside hydrolase n=1 Tax=Gordonia rhizosphera NBRC 16068 TaxID=1108045 RepID=K6WSP3_9ACTN|nr:glycoside hydrolase family 76 protein [Gordonia rhizosphera]GAB89584.1 putative glycoside hydrolase [Gordonia rhizosphera NBRC 16068]
MTADERAEAAAAAITGRHLRRMLGLPGTRLAAVAWPSHPIIGHFGMWHYWWHAHLVDVLVDAAIRHGVNDDGAEVVDRLLRGIHLRNLGRWTNNYYDDMAWMGLAIERADRHLGLRHPAAVRTLSDQMLRAWVPQLGGGIPWRKADLFFNAPANGPAAILLARTGHLERAREMADWMDSTLIDPDSHLVIDGVKPTGRDEPMERVTAIYTYCQGVVLGTELELARRTGDTVHAERIARLLDAVETRLCVDGVIPGAGGGDGGLFAGILARYLALIATDLPSSAGDTADTAADDVRRRAAAIVTISAQAAWSQRADTADGPVFGPDWHRPARRPTDDGTKAQLIGGAVHSSAAPERDLSVQISAWMTLEAAATLTRMTKK